MISTYAPGAIDAPGAYLSAALKHRASTEYPAYEMFMKSLRTITVTLLWFALLAIGHARAQCGFDRAVAVGTGATNITGIAVEDGGNLYATGRFEDSTTIGTISFPAPTGPVGSFLAKYTADLQLVWAMPLGMRDAPQVVVDNRGRVVVCGRMANTMPFAGGTLISNGDYDMVVAVFDTAGREISATNSGGASIDLARALATDGHGGVVITGVFEKTVMIGNEVYTSHGEEDMMVVALDSAGHVRWARTGGGSGRDFGHAVTVSPEGMVYVTGSFDKRAVFGSDTLDVGSVRNYGAYVVCYDAQGMQRWAIAPGGAQTSEGHGVAVGPDGSVWAAGSFIGTFVLEDRTLPDGRKDLYVMRLDTLGRLIMLRRDGSIQAEEAYGLTVSKDGSVFMAGYSGAGRDTLRFGAIATRTIAWDAFLVQFDGVGTPTCVLIGGGDLDDIAEAVAVGWHNQVFLAGAFTHSARFGATSLVDTVATSTGFIARAHFDTESAVPVVPAREGLVIRQVAGARGMFVIDGLTDVDADVRVFDILGRELGGVRINREAGRATIDLGTLPAGLYIIGMHGIGPLRSALVTVR